MLGTGGAVLDELRLLIDIQELDVELHTIRKDKDRMPRLIGFAGEEMREYQVVRDEAKAVLDSAMREKRDLEAELQTEGEHLERLKLRSSEIKDNKAYFAHLK